MINAALTNPTAYGWYYQVAGEWQFSTNGPLGSSPFVYSNAPVGGIGVPLQAYNYAQQNSNYPWTLTGDYGVPAQYGSPTTGPLNGSITTNLSGTLVYYFKATWIGSGTPTGYVDMLLRTTLSVGAGVSYGPSVQLSGLSAQGNASDGSPFNETASASAGDAGVSAAPGSVIGYHLVRAAVNPPTGIAEVFLNGTSQAEVVNTVCYDGPPPPAKQQQNGKAFSAVTASVTGGVKPDNREVTITCPSIENSYYKGVDPNSGHPIQITHQRDASGAIVTDSVVSPPLTQPGAPTTSWTANPNLLGEAPGFTNPIFAWTLTGAGLLSASGNTSQTQLSESFPVSTKSTTLSQQSTVRLSVADSDGASAANTFTIWWHYPYEKWQTYGAQLQNTPIAFPSDGPQAVNGQVTNPITSASSGINWNVVGKVGGGFLSTAGSVIGISQPETDPIVVGFFSATSYILSVLDSPPPPQPYHESGTPGQFQADVVTQVTINSGNTAGIFLPARPRLDPGLAATIYAAGNYGSYTGDIGGQLFFDCTAYREQIQQNYTGDSYGQHGYLGPAASSIVFPGPWAYVYNWFWTPTVPPPSH